MLVLRNDVLPHRIPPSGWVCLRDGDPGDPEVLLSPLAYVYEHAAEIDIVIDCPLERRDQAFDRLKLAVGSALAADRTLGGLCDYVVGEAPQPADIAIEGAEPLKAATIRVMLTYGSSDPLS